jgi:hypothetical protein
MPTRIPVDRRNHHLANERDADEARRTPSLASSVTRPPNHRPCQIRQRLPSTSPRTENLPRDRRNHRERADRRRTEHSATPPIGESTDQNSAVVNAIPARFQAPTVPTSTEAIADRRRGDRRESTFMLPHTPRTTQRSASRREPVAGVFQRERIIACKRAVADDRAEHRAPSDEADA